MSFLINDETDISKVDRLSKKRRDELAQKLKNHIKELREYRALFVKNEVGNLKSKAKIVLAAYQELFSRLTTVKAIDERMHQLLSYQKKLSRKSTQDQGMSVSDTSRSVSDTRTQSYTPSYRTPTGSKAKFEKAEITQLLLNNGGNLNEALFSAVGKGDLRLVEMLLNRGANPNYLSNDGFTPIDGAFKLKNLKVLQLLRKFEKNFPNQQDVQKMKILMKTGGVLGVNITLPLQSEAGQVIMASSLGGFAHYSLPWLTHYLNQYCRKLKSENQNERYEIFRKILKAYSRASRHALLDPLTTLQTTLSDYKSGDPIFISGEWVGHNIGVVFYKNQAGFVNRGEQTMHQYYGTGFFEMPDPAEVNEDFLASLQSLKANGPVIMKNIVKLAGNNPINCIESSFQKLGTCYFSNPKSTVELFLYWLSLDAGRSEKDAKSFALTEYKHFTEFIRNEMCQELIELYHKHPEDREFYEKIFEAIIKTHHGETVRLTSRNLEKKLLAEFNRVAMLIQAIVQVDKPHAYEFLQKLESVGETLRGIAKDEFFSQEVPLLKETLDACGFLNEEDHPGKKRRLS